MKKIIPFFLVIMLSTTCKSPEKLVLQGNYDSAIDKCVKQMVKGKADNEEKGLLDKIGVKLVDAAVKNNCGARFTGAGGGGCIWAVGDVNDIDRLKHKWEIILSGRKAAGLLNVKIDGQGLRFG